MKNYKLSLFLICLVMFLTGCASTKNTAAREKSKIDAPEWFLRGGYKDSTGIYAIGSSNFSDELMAVKAARVDGRAALAQTIESTVSYVIETNKESDDENTRRYIKEQTKIISNQMLVGSTQVDRFDYKGVVYVLMYLPYEDLLSQLKTSAAQQENGLFRETISCITPEQLNEANNVGLCK